MSIEEGLVTRIKADDSIAAILGERVYPGLIDERESLPAIAYESQGDEPAMHMGGASGISRATLLLNCWGGSQQSERATAKSLREELRNNLNGFRGLMGSHFVRACFLSDGGDITFTSPANQNLRAYGVQLEVTLWYTETVPTLS